MLVSHTVPTFHMTSMYSCVLSQRTGLALNPSAASVGCSALSLGSVTEGQQASKWNHFAL